MEYIMGFIVGAGVGISGAAIMAFNMRMRLDDEIARLRLELKYADERASKEEMWTAILNKRKE